MELRHQHNGIISDFGKLLITMYFDFTEQLLTVRVYHFPVTEEPLFTCNNL